MIAVEHAERSFDVVDGEEDGRAPLWVLDSVADDGVVDGWIASLTADQFEHVLASLARAPS